MNTIELSYVTIRYEQPVVYFTYREGAELGFPEIRELVRCAEQLSGGKPYVTFSDVRVGMNITEEGKRYVSNPDHMPLFRGTAVLVKNSMYSFAVNLMSNIQRSRYPFKAFTDKNKAINWLLSLPLTS